jgi:hypothetical protein
MKCKHCEEQAEWMDEFCQEHWEEYCAQSWWAMLQNIKEEAEVAQ